MTIEEILAALNTHKVRTTYGAVCGIASKFDPVIVLKIEPC